MSTGSFADNEAMMREALGDDVYDAAVVIGGCDGTGLEMLYANGAAKGELLTMNHGVGAKATENDEATQLSLNTPILWVNPQGKRFMNEDLLKDTVEFSSAVLAQGRLSENPKVDFADRPHGITVGCAMRDKVFLISIIGLAP